MTGHTDERTKRAVHIPENRATPWTLGSLAAFAAALAAPRALRGIPGPVSVGNTPVRVSNGLFGLAFALALLAAAWTWSGGRRPSRRASITIGLLLGLTTLGVLFVTLFFFIDLD